MTAVSAKCSRFSAKCDPFPNKYGTFVGVVLDRVIEQSLMGLQLVARHLCHRDRSETFPALWALEDCFADDDSGGVAGQPDRQLFSH